MHWSGAAALAAMLLLAPHGRAQTGGGRGCLDETQPAVARLAICESLLAAPRGALGEAMALLGRARARLDLVQAAAERASPGSAPAREEYEPILADLDRSYATFRSMQALQLRAMVRFYRGDVAPAVLPLFRNGAWEEAVTQFGPLIAADPRNPDLRILRGALRTLTGDQDGARADGEEARRIAVEAP